MIMASTKSIVTKLISRREDSAAPNGNGKRVYKLTNDKRVTRIGMFLRKTSLDELPQFLNVLERRYVACGPASSNSL